MGNNAVFFNPNLFVTFLPLYVSGIFWTVIYDTIYAHQDKKDDSEIGVKSTALKWKYKTKPFSHFMNHTMFLLMGVNGWIFSMNWSYYTILVIMHRFHHKLIQNVDLNDPESCKRYFQRMKIFGFVLALAFILGKIRLLDLTATNNVGGRLPRTLAGIIW